MGKQGWTGTTSETDPHFRRIEGRTDNNSQSWPRHSRGIRACASDIPRVYEATARAISSEYEAGMGPGLSSHLFWQTSPPLPFD